MSAHSFTTKDYFAHMLDAATQILTYIDGRSIDDFFEDRYLQDAVIRNIEILGEAARRLLAVDPDIQSKYQDIPFVAIYGMRNQLSHGYFAIDFHVVATVVEKDIPLLKHELEAAIKQMQ